MRGLQCNNHDGCTIGHATVTTYHVSVGIPVNDLLTESSSDLSGRLNKCFALENVGTECKPKCPKCLCRNCLESAHSMKEERELALIEKGLRYDAEKREWISSYPWLNDLRSLRNYVKVAIARMKSLEVRLKKLGTEYTQKYHSGISTFGVNMSKAVFAVLCVCLLVVAAIANPMPDLSHGRRGLGGGHSGYGSYGGRSFGGRSGAVMKAEQRSNAWDR